MSKIAEKKAEKLFPLKSIDGGEIEAYFNAGQLHKREIYNECYEQAFQDFMEKAEMYLKTRVYYNMHPNNVTTAIQEFKNYMKNEM